MTGSTRTALARRDRGFTLIELLVVIIVIGILAAIAIPVYLTQRKKAANASLLADLKSAATVAETIATDDPTAAQFGIAPVVVGTVKAAFDAAGFKATAPNQVWVNGSPRDGYCLRAFRLNGTSDAQHSANAYWYDTRLGGLVAGGPQNTPSGGICVTLGGGYQLQ